MRKTNGVIRLAAVLLAVITAVPAVFAGCSNDSDYAPPLTLSASMPPEVAAEHGAFTAELYFVSEDGRRLASEQHTITYSLSGSRAEAAVKELVAGPDTDKFSASIPSGFTFDRVEISNETCSVYFTGSYPETEREWLIARAALAQTLYKVEGVESVSIFLNGVEPGYYGYEMGAQRPPSDTLDVYISSMKNEFETLAGVIQSGAGTYVTRTLALYYADESGTLLMGKNVELSYDTAASKANYVEMLVNRMMQDASGRRIQDSALPEELVFAQPPRVTYIATGDSVDDAEPPEGDRSCVAELVFNSLPDGVNYDIICGALTLSITGSMTDIAGVSIRFVENPEDTGDGSYFVRGDFSGFLGRSACVLFPDADGTVLHRVMRSFPSNSIYDPSARLAALFSEPSEPGETYPLFTSEDIERVYITDDIAVVD